jgi:replicative DNA helicase
VLKERLLEYKQEIEDRKNGVVVQKFIPTGIPGLDKNGGYERGVLTIVAGHTGGGKSAWKLFTARAAAQAGYKVFCVELEDPPKRTADRAFMHATGVDSRTLAYGEVDEQSLRQCVAAYKEADWADNVVLHEGLLGGGELLALLEDNPADLVMVDYAQALGEDSEQGLEKMLRDLGYALNLYAQLTNAAVVVFSQVKTDVEVRGQRIWDQKGTIDGFRPFGKKDLAWCGALAERAKALIYLFRPGHWELKLGSAGKDDVMEVIKDKGNFGGEGRASCRWEKGQIFA